MIDSTTAVLVFGTADTILFEACLFYALIGALVMILIDVSTRNPNTSYSPVCFDIKYFLHANFLRIITNLILLVVVIRFLPDLITKFLPNYTGETLTPFWSFFIGLLSDKLAIITKRKKGQAVEYITNAGVPDSLINTNNYGINNIEPEGNDIVNPINANAQNFSNNGDDKEDN